jgi:hypothetical protein
VNRKTGKQLLTAMKPNGDVVCANDNPIYSRIPITRKEYNEMLAHLQMEGDDSVSDFTFTGEKFVKIKPTGRLKNYAISI